MDVRVLASAMASVAQLVDDAARLTYGHDASVRIEVSGDFRRGSLTYQIVATAIEGLQGNQVKELLELIGFLSGFSGFTGLTVLGVLKWLRGKKPDKIVREGNSARIIAGKQSQVVNLNVANLVINHGVRSNIEGMTQPLERPGITSMRTSGSDDVAAVEIEREERDYFLAPPPAAERLHDGTAVAVLQLVSPVFRLGNKWQFAYPGEAPFHAPILDKAFLDRLQRREEFFSFGDLLRVEMRTTVTRTEAGTLNTTREITRVIEKIPPPHQPDLFSQE